METCIKIFIFCYLLFYPHYAYAFDHVTIVNEDSIDKEFDDNVYRKNLFIKVTLILYIQKMILVTIATRYIEKRDLLVH